MELWEAIIDGNCCSSNDYFVYVLRYVLSVFAFIRNLLDFIVFVRAKSK